MSKIELTREYILAQYNGGADFRWDALSRKIQIQECNATWRNLTDKDICTIAVRCAIDQRANITDREVRLVLGSDIVPVIHPLRDWLRALPEHPHLCEFDFIDMLAQQVHVVGDDEDQLRWRTCFKKWFVAMVAGWLHDEVVNHQVLVLIGQQGIYKTTWLERLLPPELRAYVTKMPSVRELTKDDRIKIAEFGLINLDEIDAATPKELNVLKSLITSADINERAAYGHTKEQRLRVASFCASGNNREFLTDDTGNRRWLPFEVETIQNPWQTTILYERVYAQALWLAEYGFNYWFDNADIRALETHTRRFLCTRNEEELLPLYFSPTDPSDSDALFLTASEMHAKLTFAGDIRRPMPLNKFGELLRRSGFCQKRLHGGRRGYVVKTIDNQFDRQSREARELLQGDTGDTIF